MRKVNQRTQTPLFNISSDKHVSSSEMPGVGAAVKTEFVALFAALSVMAGVGEKLREVFTGVLVSSELRFGKELGKDFF